MNGIIYFMETDGSGMVHGQETDNEHDPKDEKSRLFKSTLTQILSRPLSPENIDLYAEDALTDLIGLVSSVTGEYDKQQTVQLPPNKELEDRAFTYFGLNNIEEILSNVHSKAEEIRGLDGIIARAEKRNSVVIPPEPGQEPIREGDGSFKEKSIISRTKTLLFILSNDFDIDVNDPEQLSLTIGVLTGDMMRKESYFMINVPKLNRTILSCDEEGNVTYIFDNAILESYGISQENLANMTKAEINDFLHEDQSLGKRVIYSNSFVPNMINLITDLKIDQNEHTPEGLGLYLYPKAPEGALSLFGVSKVFGIGFYAVDTAIKALGGKLGETRIYKFASTRAAIGYTPQQQEMIRQELEKRGNLSPSAPEGNKVKKIYRF